MILAIDAGNSRIKWGLHEGGGWRARHVLPTEDAAQLAAAWRQIPVPRAVAIANVAGASVRAALLAAMPHWNAQVIWATSRAGQCGVRNGYADPAQLGCDRWAALIAARALHDGDCLVVSAGTAMTVDALTRDGEFLGGVIVPGMALMQQALANNTAALQVRDGHFQEMPDNTADAIHSGAVQALCGAIERMAAAMAARGLAPLCLLSGGAAQDLVPRLNLPHQLVDNLVLEGLVEIAKDIVRA
ncbi:MAG: type III pantothenate kinase [Pseudomonadota bacterium]